MYFLYPYQKQSMRYDSTPQQFSEFAFSLSKIAYDLQKSAPALFEHLLKLFYFRDDYSFSDWKKSVYDVLSSVPKQSNTGKFPRWDAIVNILWQGKKIDKSYFRNMNNKFIKQINSSPKYKSLPKIYSDEYVEKNAYQFCYEYIEWLAEQLECYGKVSRNDAFDKIDKLLDKYLYEY